MRSECELSERNRGSGGRWPRGGGREALALGVGPGDKIFDILALKLSVLVRFQSFFKCFSQQGDCIDHLLGAENTGARQPNP